MVAKNVKRNGGLRTAGRPRSGAGAPNGFSAAAAAAAAGSAAASASAAAGVPGPFHHDYTTASMRRGVRCSGRGLLLDTHTQTLQWRPSG